MPKNSFLQALFKGPKFSIAPIEENNRGSSKIGAVIPVYANILNSREGIELNMAHLVRFLPAKAPVMEGYKVTFDAFAVPYSCLGYAERKERDIDDFFNLKENAGYIENPFCKSMSSLRSKLIEGTPNSDDVDGFKPASLANLFMPHTLSDYLNMPSLKSVRDHVKKWLSVNPFLYGSNLAAYYVPDSDTPLDSVGYSVGSFVALAYWNRLVQDAAEDEYYSLTIDASGRGHGIGSFVTACPFSVSSNPLIVVDEYRHPTVNSDYYYTDTDDDGIASVTFGSLLGYVLNNYPAVAYYYGYEYDESDTDRQGQITNMVNHILYLMDEENPISLDYLQVLYDNYGIDAQSIYDEYFEYMMRHILYNSSLKNRLSALLYSFAEDADSQQSTFLPSLPDDDPIDMSYFAAYWKIISDWYINTNIDGDPDDFFLEHCKLLSHSSDDGSPAGYLDQYVNVTPFVRRWANDVFTSSVPESAVQNIRIPTDGTIPDLRDANAAQKLKDILRNTGNRLRDVVYGLRGILPSAVRSEMSEPIATMSTWVGMQSVLQTSQTTPDSPQAAYSGIGTDSQGHRRMLKYINNEEPTPVIVMVLMSVTQRASYMQGFDRKFFRKSIYDFAIPQLAMVGEQEVTNKEVYFDKNYDGGIFGFNRRYYDWFQSQSQVHGDLRDSLDYWHGARFFDDQPSLNPEFIGINSDVDHLQRVFANVSESSHPILYNLSFDGYCTRALPRYIQYEL